MVDNEPLLSMLECMCLLSGQAAVPTCMPLVQYWRCPFQSRHLASTSTPMGSTVLVIQRAGHRISWISRLEMQQHRCERFFRPHSLAMTSRGKDMMDTGCHCIKMGTYKNTESHSTQGQNDSVICPHKQELQRKINVHSWHYQWCHRGLLIWSKFWSREIFISEHSGEAKVSIWSTLEQRNFHFEALWSS